CRAMAHYALTKGKSVPAEAIKTIEPFQSEFQDNAGINGAASTAESKGNIVDLVHAHIILAKVVEPATPEAILLLDREQAAPSRWHFLGPVNLVRHMMLVTILSLVLFIGLALSSYIHEDIGNLFEMSGFPLLIQLLFLIAAASMGACFAALY